MTAAGQTALADPPALQFSPVILWRGELVGRSFDVSSFFATEDANSDRSGLAAPLGDRQHWPAQKLASKVGVGVREYWCIGDGMKAREGPVAFVSDARRIRRVIVPVDC